ncbi:CLUMA_CG001118, isoform A [Clunio marinus]|uniref:CLUMA_CG001118, isoform A n=1 Tax=Clunio marinus TaxID=568069 RepID=A0A1J1HIT8_9DIPT|nr:CLUMA_CG001118, isoform A [Clunio marinus]
MICELSDNVGKVYAVPFWSQHSITCFHALIFFKNSVNYLVSPNSEGYQNFLMTIYPLLLLWFILLIMFGLSIWMKNQAEEIVKIGLQIQYKVKSSPKIIKFAQLLSLQLHHRPPLISYGVFVVDWKFLFATFCLILGDILSFLHLSINHEAFKIHGFICFTIEYTQDKRLKFKKSWWEFVWFVLSSIPTLVVLSSVKVLNEEVEQKSEILIHGFICFTIEYTQDKRLKFKKSWWELVWFVLSSIPNIQKERALKESLHRKLKE